MFFLIAIAFLLKQHGTQAELLPAPAPTSFAFDAPIFATGTPSDGCHRRTVLDILWSCLATTFACTWVSVHPNVPFEGEGRWTLLRRRIFLMFFSILAPEFMIMWSFKQWRGAVMISEAINEARQGSGWTTTHGHFLQMGGFRYEWDEPGCTNGYVMKFNMFKDYLQKGKINFPTISEDEINDRSKGDALSKGIALLQLTWFIIQIIARATQGLAISELELTTAALAGLNSVMYIFWWSKPRDVRFPIVIRSKALEERLAGRSEKAISFSSEEFHLRAFLWASVKGMANSLRTFLKTFPKRVICAAFKLAAAVRALPHALYRYFVRSIGESKHTRARASFRPEIVDLEFLAEVHRVNSHIPTGSMSHLQRFKIALIVGAENAASHFALLLSLLVNVINFGLVVPIAQILYSDERGGKRLPMVFDSEEQVRVFSMVFYSENAGVRPLLGTSSIAGALFGGVHCLAWHFSFPSHVEQVIWKTASLGVAGVCALWFLGTHTWKYIDDLEEGDDLDEIYSFPRFLLRIVLLLLTTLVYSVARLLLLTLAVTSLRSLPPSAFSTVQWVEFVPHI